MTEDWQAWVGRTDLSADTVSPRAARQMLATLDTVSAPAPLADGDPLPPLWHWLAWQPEAPQAGLGPDGHPARGGFLPPVPLERRMWAGSRMEYLGPLHVGQAMERRSTILKVSEKTGAAGQMVFVTLAHEISGADGIAIREEQDIVYIAMPEQFTPPVPTPLPETLAWQEAQEVGTVRLFRFSALTFNAHRIHFDLPYATGVEKYPGLVVHGPLQAIMLMAAARRHRGGVWPRAFRFRGLRPAFHFDPLTLAAAPEAAGKQALMTATPEGAICCSAEVTW